MSAQPKQPTKWTLKMARLKQRALDLWTYCSEGVWEEHSDTMKVKAIKTINLTIRTFLSNDLQSQACAMTYRTLLAIVPALALLFAIGRGFGLQNLLMDQLYSYLPSQHKALEMAFSFVDSCLAQASEGVFVGVGIVFLLWTIISLLSCTEEAFNQIWGVRIERSIFRKVTDYLAICIILPILMICSSGLRIVMSNTIQHFLPYHFVTPIIEVTFDVMSYLLACAFFVGAYMLIPNTKVKFKNAFIGGLVAGTAFQILQWLFISGQIYVAKYNAIYGSFSFLPLMLIWMQLSWLITLAGALIACSAQNISMFSFERQIRNISINYKIKVTVAVLAVILRRFEDKQSPISAKDIAETYMIPSRLSSIVIDWLIEANLIIRVVPVGEKDIDTALPVMPAMSVDHYTIDFVYTALRNQGDSEFITSFKNEFPEISDICDRVAKIPADADPQLLLVNIPTNKPK